jgi:ribosomal protein S27AE
MVGQVIALKCVCERCGHVMLRMDEPRWCGKCKSPYWNTARKPGQDRQSKIRTSTHTFE